LIDYSRNDPYAATPTPRALMLSVFQPAKCASTVPVPIMPDEVADYQGPFLQETFNISANFTPLFLEARLPVCSSDHARGCSALDDSPILLFSPGYSIPRFYYNVLASAIASEGFTVITIDHPEDTNIIVYPDGHAVYNNASILDSPTWDLYPLAADTSFVIDQLSNATAIAALLPRRGPRPFRTYRVAALGHSVGGAAAVVAASRDPRIRGAINWDGTILGMSPPAGEPSSSSSSPQPSLPVRPMAQPVLFMSHQNFLDPTWTATWERLAGPKMIVYVENTTHYTFSDVPTLLQAAGQSTEPWAELLGTIAPAEMVRVLTAYTTAWMRAVFAGNMEAGGPLLKETAPGRFPGVSILMKGNL
jgi:dienelactone hydrolase